MKKERNIAYIDGQNLHLGVLHDNWKIDHRKLRIYLKDKYHVDEAYYFLGYIKNQNQDLYKNLQRSGFIIHFKEHEAEMMGKKKGNVDTDIVFEVMKSLVEGNNFDKVIMVSGDGDYKKMIDYLIQKKKFKKILFPNKKFASSLYKKMGAEHFDYLEHIKTRIAYGK